MPRPAPNRERLPIPETQPRQLREIRQTFNRHYYRAFARVLGVGELADEFIETLVELVASHRASLTVIKRHTPRRVAAALAVAERDLENGYDRTKAVTEIADPWFGNTDFETHWRLAELVNDPSIPAWVRAGVIRERRLEVERLPAADAYHGVVTITAIHALLMWQRWSVRRHNRTRQWQFVLGVLEAAGVGTEGFRINPARLKGELEKMIELTSIPLPLG
jgi:hypothetical protein